MTNPENTKPERARTRLEGWTTIRGSGGEPYKFILGLKGVHSLPCDAIEMVARYTHRGRRGQLVGLMRIGGGSGNGLYKPYVMYTFDLGVQRGGREATHLVSVT